MIKDKKCIDNYLDALLTGNSVDEQLSLLTDAIMFSSAISSNENIWLFLNSPLMSSVEKSGVLSNFAKKLNTNKQVVNLFNLFVKNKRLSLVKDLLLACQKRKDQLSLVSNIELRSSHPMSEEQKTSLLKHLQSMGFSNINLSSKVDPSIGFGFKLLTDNKEYDLSLKSIFEEFKEKIIKNN